MNFLSVAFDDMNAFAFLKPLHAGTLLTPNIDRVMAMGTTFENAFSQVAVCNASRASALSGLDPALTGVHMNYEYWAERIDPAATLPAVLRDAGYNTSLIGKVFHDETTSDALLDTISDFHFRSPEASYEFSTVLTPHPLTGPVTEQGDYVNVSQAIGQLNAAGDDPFAMFLGIAKPHLGWVVPQEYFDMYPLDEIELPFALDGDLSDVPEFMKALVEDQLHDRVVDAGAWKTALQGYFASITFADAMLGRVLDTLEANGQLDTTAIMLWTDHGYHLGDKDNWHKFTLWEEAARAPMVLALPGGSDNGQRVEQTVELVDMMPTVLDLLGLDAPEGLSGRSLLPFVADPSLTDNGAAITTMYGSAAIRTNRYRYIRYEDGSAELYDIVEDPNQWDNLIEETRFAATAEKLDARLRADLGEQGWIFADAGTSAEGSAADNVFVLAPGAVRATGGAGDDAYFINDVAVKLIEGAGRGLDSVYVAGSYTLPANIENLELRLRASNATLVGNALANDIVGGRRLEGLDGNDRLQLRGEGEAFGGAGDDLVEALDRDDLLSGGTGNDILVARGGNDLLGGGEGDDRIDGGGGIDTASYSAATGGVIVRLSDSAAQETGGAGKDMLSGIEDLLGSDFADRLVGDAGSNRLNGGDGNDTLDGGAEIDTMIGRGGNDRFVVADAGDKVIEQAGEGRDEVRSSIAHRLAEEVEVLRLIGTARAGSGNELGNTIVGNASDNILLGLAGADSLSGGAGIDQLRGAEGSDRLDGGSGRDTVTGGAGADLFLFAAGDTGATRPLADFVSDFDRSGGDRISLATIDAVEGAGGNQAFSFVGRQAFSGAAGELRAILSNGETLVAADTDGDRAADFVIRVSGTEPLTAADFVL